MLCCVLLVDTAICIFWGAVSICCFRRSKFCCALKFLSLRCVLHNFVPVVWCSGICLFVGFSDFAKEFPQEKYKRCMHIDFMLMPPMYVYAIRRCFRVLVPNTSEQTIGIINFILPFFVRLISPPPRSLCPFLFQRCSFLCVFFSLEKFTANCSTGMSIWSSEAILRPLFSENMKKFHLHRCRRNY